MLQELLRKIIPEHFRPIGYLSYLTCKRTNCSVFKGPFIGMRYIASSVGSAYIPKLLGIYEQELNSCVEPICAGKPALIVDIGTAEGYYAIGLARRNPSAKVIGFEMEERGRNALREMAEINEVSSRLTINGKCEPQDLAKALGETTLEPVVICDVEGYEEKLLDPQVIPALQHAHILVELHDFCTPGITELLKTRFAATHQIKHIWQEPRIRADFPWRTIITSLLPSSYLDWAVSEWRPVKMAWLWMVPLT